METPGTRYAPRCPLPASTYVFVTPPHPIPQQVVNGGYRPGRGKALLTQIFDHAAATMPRRVNLTEGEKYMDNTVGNHGYVERAMAIPGKYPDALTVDDTQLWQQLNVTEGSEPAHLMGVWPLHASMEDVVTKIGAKLSAVTTASFSSLEAAVDKDNHALFRNEFNSYHASLGEAPGQQPRRYGSFAAGGKPLPALNSSKGVAQPAAEGEAATADADKLPANTKSWEKPDAARRYARRLLGEGSKKKPGVGVTVQAMSTLAEKMHLSRKSSIVTDDLGVLAAMYELWVLAINVKEVASLAALNDTCWPTLLQAVEARKPPREKGGEVPPAKKARKASRKSGGTNKAAGRKRAATEEVDEDSAVEEEEEDEDDEEDNEVSVSATAPMSSVRLTQTVKDAAAASVRAVFSDMRLMRLDDCASHAQVVAVSEQMVAVLAAIGDVGTKLVKFGGEWSAANELYATQQKLAQTMLDLKQTESDMAKIMGFAGAMVGSASPEEARHTISAMRTLAAVYPEMRPASVAKWRRIAISQTMHPDIIAASKPLPVFDETN
jgi:hypothetical protein